MIERRVSRHQEPIAANVFSRVKKASLESLQLREPHFKQLLRHWTEMLRDLGLPEQERKRLTIHDFASLSKSLQAMDFRSFREELLSMGERLARQHVDIDTGMVLLESLTEDYVSSLRESGLREGEAWRDQPRRTEALAIVRLGLLAERILAAGYSRQVEEERKMWTSRLSGSDQDLQQTSVLLTKVFERERYKLSRQLHEKLGHYLVGLRLQLHMASQALREGKTEQCSVAFEKSVAVVDEAMRSVRRLVLDLGPAVVKEVGLVPAVRMYVRQFSSRSWIDVIVEVEDLPAEVPRLLQVALYRLSVQMLDFCRRAGAQNIEISFKGKKESIAIIVEASGISAAALRGCTEESWAMLRASAELLGAILHRTSRETCTKIELLVPLRGLGKTGAGRSVKSECHQDPQS